MSVQTIGPFSVQDTFAQSRWSVIYTCTAPDGRKCALKVFELGEMIAEKSPEHVQIWQRRFVQERWLLSELADPNLIRAVGGGEDQFGRPYFVMPFMAANLIGEIGRDIGEKVDVATLSPRRRPRPVPVGRAMAILRQIVRGVSALHQRGIVHRDIKPGNILMTRRKNGRVKIADLGMASVQGRVMDVAGEVLGTTGYRAPEIRDALSVDPRIDVFAIGAIGYRMLTGLPIRRDDRPVVELNPAVLVELASIVDRATQQDPAARFDDATAMGMELERLVKSSAFA